MTDQTFTWKDYLVWSVLVSIMLVLLLKLLGDFRQFLHRFEDAENAAKTSQNYRRPFLDQIITGQELFLFNKPMRQNGLKTCLG